MAKSFDPTRLGDRDYRLNNLYKVQTKQGGVVDFVMKPAQRMYVEASWWRNIILKPRQLGYTTVIDLLGLDLALFRPNTSVVIIAHTGDAAKDIFRRVVKFAYDNLHPELKKILHLAEKPSQSRLAFANGSQIQVSTGARSGTHQFVHVSEMGPLSVMFPAKASEIMTGTIETVAQDGYIVIESTAKGPFGTFYDMVTVAKENRRLFLAGQKRFTPLDYCLHFIPWFSEPAYRMPLDGHPLNLPSSLEEYFAEFYQKHPVYISDEQKKWYMAKWQAFGGDSDKLLQEYPGDEDEPFMATMKGRIFQDQVRNMHAEHRVGKFTPIANWPTDVAWDIGHNDSTVMIFTQTVGNEIRIIDTYANNNQPIDHYAKVLKFKGFRYGTLWGPHDIGNTSIQTGRTTMAQAALYGMFFTRVPKCNHKIEAINAARTIFASCRFNEDTCSMLLEKLSQYRWKLDVNGDATGSVVHCDYSDAFQTLGQGHVFGQGATTQNIVAAGGY